MCQTRKQLPNHTTVEKWQDDDGCPVHGTEVKKTYTFGWSDSFVTVFAGCKCAMCHYGDALAGDPSYHTDYASAAGKARMIKAFEATW